MNGSLPYKGELSESDLRNSYSLYQKKNITLIQQFKYQFKILK